MLLGLGNVADVLRALEEDGKALAARDEQAARADDAFRIALARYDAGGVSQVAVLDADRQRLQAEIERVQASAARYADAAALFQAMGGGWGKRKRAGPCIGVRPCYKAWHLTACGGLRPVVARLLTQGPFCPYNRGLFAFRTACPR